MRKRKLYSSLKTNYWGFQLQKHDSSFNYFRTATLHYKISRSTRCVLLDRSPFQQVWLYNIRKSLHRHAKGPDNHLENITGGLLRHNSLNQNKIRSDSTDFWIAAYWKADPSQPHPPPKKNTQSNTACWTLHVTENQTMINIHKPSHKRLKGLEAIFPQLIILNVAVLND